MKFIFPLLITVFLLTCCLHGCQQQSIQRTKLNEVSFYTSSKPCSRWWWFATEIKKEDIREQLKWFKKMNFGGVEIAWVYPLYRYQQMYAQKYGRHYPKDTTAQQWLSPEWSEIVTYTKM